VTTLPTSGSVASYAVTNEIYYYNWYCVNTNEAVLCPAPWRLPTKTDYDTLVKNSVATTLESYWGFTGAYYSTGLVNADVALYEWSNTATSGAAYNYDTAGHDHYVGTGVGNLYGMPVRCVK
jgi:hypothetical protein